VQVVAQDATGATVSSFSGTITVALGTNPSGGTLAGTTTVAAVNGVATFANLSIDRAGNGYTLQATSSGLTSATSAAFNITSRLVFLDQNNGTLGESGRVLLKGFNPTNPHRGSAIVATFFWLGSTNIITAVSDHLSDATLTPVGNTYTLVEYVTSGGISMATYVATNIQNFPDPCCDAAQAQILVVQADLSSPVTDGGVAISAYTGINAVQAQALGAHRSAVGASSSTTTADPGAIPAGAGALVYAVTMSNGVEVGVTGPGGFTSFGTGTDAWMVVNSAYLIQGAASSVDPQWTWYFSSPKTWLATVLALNPAAPP
jgi:hypothetical protein